MTNIFEYMKQVSRETDSSILGLLEEVKTAGRDVYDYTSHLLILRNKLNGDIAVPKARNALGRLVYECLTDENPEKINPVLAFIELSTSATYVLDDIIDNQPERQKDIATWKKYGTNKAIIAGGIQTFLAMNSLEHLDITSEDKLKVYSLANAMWLKLWFGEGFNEEMKEGTTLNEYIGRCYDVAGVMFDTVARMAAICANASEKQIQLAGELGNNYGIAMMIRNDLVDVLPKVSKHSTALSKKAYEDIEKGIWTYPVIHAMQNCNEKDKEFIRNVLGQQNSDGDEEKLYNLLTKVGSIDATLVLISHYQQKALQKLQEFPDFQSKNLLKQLIGLLANMKKYK